eukprot:jgi/Chrzof1/6189/Cz17g14240.t1
MSATSPYWQLLRPMQCRAYASQAPKTDTKAVQQTVSKAERLAANFEFSRKRAAWKRQMTELRKQWLAEHRQKHPEQQKPSPADKAQKAQSIAEWRAQRQLERESMRQPARLQQEIRQAERDVENARQRLEAAVSSAQKQQLVQQRKQARMAELEQASKSWIPKEAFEERVNAALDSPVSL